MTADQLDGLNPQSTALLVADGRQAIERYRATFRDLTEGHRESLVRLDTTLQILGDDGLKVKRTESNNWFSLGLEPPPLANAYVLYRAGGLLVAGVNNPRHVNEQDLEMAAQDEFMYPEGGTEAQVASILTPKYPRRGQTKPSVEVALAARDSRNSRENPLARVRWQWSGGRLVTQVRATLPDGTKALSGTLPAAQPMSLVDFVAIRNNIVKAAGPLRRRT